MADDRVIRFNGKHVPTRAELQVVLEDLLGGVGKIEWSEDRFFVTLPGEATLALQRTAPLFIGKEGLCHKDGRWFEVWIGDDCIDVMTRLQDDFTNALAARFASIVETWWDGEYEESKKA